MGHRLSKSGSNAATDKGQRKRHSKNPSTAPESAQSSNTTSTAVAASLEHQNLGPTIKLISGTQQFNIQTRRDSRSSSSSSYNNLRQIIIKIQLAKMEPGDNDTNPMITDGVAGSNNNLNVERSNLTVNAISFQRNIACDQGNEIKLNNLSVGSSVVLNNNNFVNNFAAVPYVDQEGGDDARNLTNLNIMVRQMGDCQIMDNASNTRQGSNNNDGGGSNRSSTSSTELWAEIVEGDVAAVAGCPTTSTARTTVCGDEDKTYCCRRKKSSSGAAQAANSSSSSSAYPSKWRCCKCTCRDALKKLRSSNKKQNQQPSQNENSVSELQAVVGASAVPSNEMHPTAGNHLAIWSPANDVIIPLASPQIVVVQYPPTSAVSHLVSLGPIDEHAIRLIASDLAVPATPDSTNSMAAASPCSTLSIATTPNGTVVHSQVDYIHCLVPDLERITKSSFYWGKMDRYEAERLLEGKPEGTFLLRDSAQEEYLFSVTFRKYGRSLHARIEQYNHRFSFDCHDPGVFTASTVTGLLEHYKDPSCVMFFEPMLAIPLHRNATFSLQQLCRATIVSNTTYDGITELEIPSRLKSYLKEYHYKQRFRVKPFDLYSCT